MRTTLSCLLGALLIAACWAQTAAIKGTKTDGLFQQAINHLTLLIQTEKDSDLHLYSPTNDIKECCTQSAFECFRKQLTSPSHNALLKKKLARNLGKPSIMNSLNTCTAEEIRKTECMSCESYPVVKSKYFLMNLQSRLQKSPFIENKHTDDYDDYVWKTLPHDTLA